MSERIQIGFGFATEYHENVHDFADEQQNVRSFVAEYQNVRSFAAEYQIVRDFAAECQIVQHNNVKHRGYLLSHSFSALQIRVLLKLLGTNCSCLGDLE